MDGIDLASMNNTQRGNVPYLVILYKMLEKWKTEHENNIPRTYKEKKEFKVFVQQEVGLDDGVPVDEDNVEEAIRNVNHKMVETKIPLDLQNILEDPLCTNITPTSSIFGVLARAVREFVYNEGNGHLPLRGSIPDMISSSDMYVQLQRVYQLRASRDVDAVYSHAQQIMSSIGKKQLVSKLVVKEFCTNSAFVKYTKYRSISEEYSNLKCEGLRSLLDNPNDDSVYYILLRAAEKYFSIYQNYPGEKKDMFESDVAQMKAIVLEFLCSNGLSCNISDDYITEFCRYGGAEIQSIAAFVGGVASQEVIKLITHQYVPFNNTLIYHAASSNTLTLNL